MRKSSLHTMFWLVVASQIAKSMRPTWGPSGSCRPQMGPMLAPRTLLSGLVMLVARQQQPWYWPGWLEYSSFSTRKRGFMNLNKMYKTHQTNVWWTMKVFHLHCFKVKSYTYTRPKLCQDNWFPIKSCSSKKCIPHWNLSHHLCTIYTRGLFISS